MSFNAHCRVYCIIYFFHRACQLFTVPLTLCVVLRNPRTLCNVQCMFDFNKFLSLLNIYNIERPSSASAFLKFDFLSSPLTKIRVLQWEFIAERIISLSSTYNKKLLTLKWFIFVLESNNKIIFLFPTCPLGPGCSSKPSQTPPQWSSCHCSCPSCWTWGSSVWRLSACWSNSHLASRTPQSEHWN